MIKKEFIYAMRITKLGENDYYVDYPFEGLSIGASAESFSEAVELAKSSLEFTLFDMYENEEPFPEFDLNEVSELEKNKDENEHITFVTTNMNNILQRFGDGTVKRTISIKQYQHYYLEKNNISISKYVQNKLDRDIL